MKRFNSSKWKTRSLRDLIMVDLPLPSGPKKQITNPVGKIIF